MTRLLTDEWELELREGCYGRTSISQRTSPPACIFPPLCGKFHQNERGKIRSGQGTPTNSSRKRLDYIHPASRPLPSRAHCSLLSRQCSEEQRALKESTKSQGHVHVPERVKSKTRTQGHAKRPAGPDAGLEGTTVPVVLFLPR